MKNLFFLLLCLFCISTEPTIYAQKDIFLQEFTDSTMFNFVGTAQLFNKRIRLTEAKNFQGGGIWLKDKNIVNINDNIVKYIIYIDFCIYSSLLLFFVYIYFNKLSIKIL